MNGRYIVWGCVIVLLLWVAAGGIFEPTAEHKDSQNGVAQTSIAELFGSTTYYPARAEYGDVSVYAAQNDELFIKRNTGAGLYNPATEMWTPFTYGGGPHNPHWVGNVHWDGPIIEYMTQILSDGSLDADPTWWRYNVLTGELSKIEIPSTVKTVLAESDFYSRAEDYPPRNDWFFEKCCVGEAYVETYDADSGKLKVATDDRVLELTFPYYEDLHHRGFSATVMTAESLHLYGHASGDKAFRYDLETQQWSQKNLPGSALHFSPRPPASIGDLVVLRPRSDDATGLFFHDTATDSIYHVREADGLNDRYTHVVSDEQAAWFGGDEGFLRIDLQES